LEDTDVGAFLRRMFPEEAGVAEPVSGTGSIPISLSISAPESPAEVPPSAEASTAQPTERVEPTPVEPAPTEVLPGATRPARRWVGAALAVVAIAAVTAVTVRSGPDPLRAWRERRTPPAVPPTSGRGPDAVPASAPGDVSAPRQPAEVTVGPAPAAAAADGAAATPSTETPPASVEPVSRSRGGAAAPGTVRVALLIRAKPWARLRIDGKRAGDVQGSRTLRLTAGRHVVELTGPDGVPSAYPVELLQGHTATLEHPPADR
ncbi:MAG: hypothetical protein ACXWK9_04615, partial [Myxococcaceae bacterium]